MTAVNAGVHELTGVRLPLQPYPGGHAVFMYSTASDGNVTLQLKEPDDLDRNSLAAMLARLQDDATFSISYQDTDILSDGSIDVLLGTGTANTGGSDAVTATFDLFDSSSGPDLTLSPQTFTNSAEAFINDNSNSLGVSADSDAVSTTTADDKKPGSTSELVKVSAKRSRPKPTSPNRQGPQQCQVCAKVFGNASALAKHKLTHSDERKYVCSMCGKAFKRQDHLNGHMLTHRNKKPYECKAEGCGKSYCDARSLRRHTENHHSTGAASSTTMSPAQGAASGDAASPHGSSCIQYAPPPTATSPGAASTSSNAGKSQLQQLLATDPAKSGNGGSNDGLTKQQLDLIHQIMEQTQRQSQQAAVSSKPSSSKPASKAGSKTSTKTQSKAWSSTSAQQQHGSSSKTTASGAGSPQAKVTTTTPATSPVNSTTGKPEQKPVECNLCHRKFKNIPALNGHMRLHGGYFKKDSENKKCEKKDPAGPPLQTASVSVRALIEEKIINKRITNPQSSGASQSQEESKPNAPPLFPLAVHSSGNADLESKISSFAVPAPPQQTTEKARRHSDAEAFRTSTTQQEAQALADLILKREKASVKRTASDPGQSQSSPLIQFQPADSFTLANVTYQSEDTEYISSSLQDEVFTQVQDTMLLQGVDPNQLASIQFQTETLLQDQNDQQLQEFKLEDINLQESVVQQSPSYQSSHSVNQELQAVLDSPLPESLAEFSTFHSTNSLDMPSPGYQTHSPSQYARSPHTITAQSPLQSPLIRHDSPGFAYPTPPASHEGQSPGFGQSTMLPMVSPTTQEFGQIVERGMYEPPQASSPLSAAFFTSTMSSSEAVEEALEEVLPGEPIYPLTNSPTPQSPLGLTPVPSPISSIVTSDHSPHPSTTFSPSPNTSTFSIANNWCNGVMLPNSDDPLLSSSSKDFVAKKKFEFNGVPLRLISNNGLIELNSTNFAGILVDANGEIKLIQTGGNNFQTKNFVLANTQIVTHEASGDDKTKVQKVVKTVQCAIPTKTILTRPKQQVEVKREEGNDVFLSPTTIPASPVRTSRKRPRTEPLQLPVFHQSKLRATRSKPQGSAPYTPQPILNPQRPGTGLYSNLKHKSDEGVSWSSEPIPETDSTPHVNVGPQFQCTVPPFTSVPNRTNLEPTYEDLLWDPGINNCTDSEVDMYLDFACCAAVPGGGRNKEYAMHLLHMCGGNIHDAMLRLMQPSPNLPTDHPLLAYQYSESDKWSSVETDIFHKALLKYDKDFRSIAQEIRTKTIKQCVQFYYVWKKVCADEYRRLKQIRERRNSYLKGSESDADEKLYPDAKLLGIADSGSPMPVPETRGFVCEFPDCSASFNSRAALNGHIRIHGGTARNSPTPSSTVASDRRTVPASTTVCHPDSTDEYPCKICGKVFTKIKSRSAHMKSHRPPDAEPVKRKEKDPLSCSSYELSVPSPFST